jgi:hypothetical protein
MATILPLSVVEWSGVGEGNPLVNDGDSSLAKLNDGGSTFNEIADVIEKQF